MTDNTPKAVYLRMLDAYNDGTPESYGSARFLDHFSDDAIFELSAMVGVPARREARRCSSKVLWAPMPPSETGIPSRWRLLRLVNA